MKKYMSVLFFLMASMLLFVVACNDKETLEQTIDFTDSEMMASGSVAIEQLIDFTDSEMMALGSATLEQTIDFIGLEITVSQDIGFTRFRSGLSENDGAYVFYIPVTVTNRSNSSRGLEYWHVRAFLPDGTEISTLDLAFSQVFEENNIFRMGDIQPGATKSGNIYLFYHQDGDHVLEFYYFDFEVADAGGNFDDIITQIHVTIGVEFNFDSLPEIVTLFEMGETFAIDGLEVTINEITSWGTFVGFDDIFRGYHYFVLSVTLRNTSEHIRSFIWGIYTFAPNGNALGNISRLVDGDSITGATSVEPGETMSAYLHVLYINDGDYMIKFPNPLLDDLYVRVPVTHYQDEIHQLDSIISRALTSSEMLQFEAAHAVSPERERYLAFGAFIITYNRESSRVFELGHSGNHALGLLRRFWGIEDREGTLEQLQRLITATGQSPIADEIYRNFILSNQLDHLDPLLMFITGFDFSDFENLYSNSVSRAEQVFESLYPDFGVFYPDETDLIDAEEIFDLLVYIQFAERVNRGLDAFIGARDLLINVLGYTEDELLNISSLAAWDYGRVAFVARYSVAAGFLEEEEAWEYIKIAADRASELYTDWREFTAAHILGRALAFGNPSDDFRYVLDFLLNHPESPFKTVDFHS